MAKPEIVILTNSDQLKSLAKLIRIQESNSIHKTTFKSESDRAKFLHDSKTNYESVIKLLNLAVETKAKFDHQIKLRPITNDIYLYVIYCVNSALQTVRNYSIRKSYLEKIEDHVVSELISELVHLDPEKPSNEEVQRLADEARESKDAMLELITKYRSKASLEYSKWLKSQGITFDQLVQRTQAKLKIPGTFKPLKKDLKFKVYNEIAEASGRGKIVSAKNLDRVFKTAGKTLMVYGSFMMAWDIYSADHPEEQAIRDVVGLVAKLGGAYLGELIGVAVATPLFAGVAGATFLVAMTGLVTGFIGAFIVGAAAGLLVDHFMGSGGGEPYETRTSLCYVMEMPDGVVLARQLTHHKH